MRGGIRETCLIGLLARRFDFTFDVLPARGADPRSLLLTMGGALYFAASGCSGARIWGYAWAAAV